MRTGAGDAAREFFRNAVADTFVDAPADTLTDTPVDTTTDNTPVKGRAIATDIATDEPRDFARPSLFSTIPTRNSTHCSCLRS